MAERITSKQLVQVGKEGTTGAGTAATTQLTGIKITPTPKLEMQTYTQQGRLFPTVVALGKDYTEFKIDGYPVYEELDFIFGSCLCTGASGVYSPKTDLVNAHDTYVVEIGNATQCEEFNYAAVTGFTFKHTRNSIDLSGEGIGGKIATGAFTASLSPAATITPIQPKDVSVKQDGTTLSRVFEAEVKVSGTWKPVWTLDASEDSYVALVDANPDATVTLKLEADSTGVTFLNAARTGNATTVIDIVASNGTKSCTISCVCKVKEVQSFEDEDGVYAVSYVLQVVYDPAKTYAIKATVV